MSLFQNVRLQATSFTILMSSYSTEQPHSWLASYFLEYYLIWGNFFCQLINFRNPSQALTLYRSLWDVKSFSASRRSFPLKKKCFLFFLVPVKIDGSYTGNLRFSRNGHWGPLDIDGWGMNSAKVVCRQLGHTDAIAPFSHWRALEIKDVCPSP